MPSPRWLKLLRDMWLTRGRVALMVSAIAASIVGFGTVLNAYAILTPELSRNYLETNPAAATLEIDRVDPAILERVRQRPGIRAAEARTTLVARVQVAPNQWRPLLLFVISDFDAIQIGSFQYEAGAWPPPTGSMLVERTALPLLNAPIGGQVLVKTPHGQAQLVTLSGSVHDPALAPAWQEREGYGYITLATLAQLGEPGQFSELKIRVTGSAFDQVTIERTTRDLAAWLQQQGYPVHELQIPPAGQHPHQGQMRAVLALLLSFSVMALVLSAILVATMIAGMMAQQIRQIGAMKTIGARTAQIAGMYLTVVLLQSSLAFVLAVLPSMLVGRMFAAAVADLLNFTIASDAIPAWSLVVQVLAGLLVPVLIALVPILRTSRITVQEALSDYGVSTTAVDRPGLLLRLSSRYGLNRTLMLALRNTFRRRGRLVLTLGLLSAGGAMFMIGLNIRDGWNQIVADGSAARHYQLEIRLNQAEPQAALRARLGQVAGVQAVEAWGYAPTSLVRPGAINLVHSYPDGGHGAFALRAPPANTRLVSFPVLAGRWLQPSDTDAVVLNQMALVQLPGIGVGDRVTLAIGAQAASWRVVGIVQEIGLGAAAYVTDTAFAQASGLGDRTRSLRLVIDAHDSAATAATIRSVEQSLSEAGVGVATTISDADLRAGLDGHILLLIVALVFTATLMAVVGVLGLTASMSTAVAERTREFGVLQMLGVTPQTVGWMVVSEGLLIGGLSWILAIGMAIPLSGLMNGLVGRMLFNAALPLVLAPQPMLIWLGIVLGGAVVASALPAQRAARLTVHAALAYV